MAKSAKGLWTYLDNKGSFDGYRRAKAIARHERLVMRFKRRRRFTYNEKFLAQMGKGPFTGMDP